ncbi:hypothetical protein SBBP2_1290025 [Burkholderiales bacterium]|nr:hypothetical protein SBBP2_1290025 [Burkholderiales bacterium]
MLGWIHTGPFGEISASQSAVGLWPQARITYTSLAPRGCEQMPAGGEQKAAELATKVPPEAWQHPNRTVEFTKADRPSNSIYWACRCWPNASSRAPRAANGIQAVNNARKRHTRYPMTALRAFVRSCD